MPRCRKSSSTTLIPQDPEVFAESILFNITLGIEAQQGAVEEAIRLARFDSVVARLPSGINTSIAEKGVNLSGGEKQRLALARGFFFAKESSIILLDEPTSSVDVINERMIYDNILKAKEEGKIIISSIHKLHLLELFDTVYVFSHGRVVESGAVNELIERKGELWNMMKSYRQEVA